MVTGRHLAWLAGLLEGEGYFGITYDKRRDHYRVRVQLKMVDKDVVERAHELTGLGTIYRAKDNRPNHSDCWVWSVASQNEVVVLLENVLPWMGERRTSKIVEMLKLVQSAIV